MDQMRIWSIKRELRVVRDFRIEAQLRFELIDLLFKLRRHKDSFGRVVSMRSLKDECLVTTNSG